MPLLTPHAASGTFGRVLECWDRKNKDYCAVKIVRNVKKYRDAAMIEVKQEQLDLLYHVCSMLLDTAALNRVAMRSWRSWRRWNQTIQMANGALHIATVTWKGEHVRK